MKILILSDLHFNKNWFEWAKSSAQSYQLVAIAGDLLDGYYKRGLMEQILWLHKWLCGFPAPIAFCSGNHDANEPNLGMEALGPEVLSQEDRKLARSALTANRWMDMLDMPNTVTDNQSKIVRTNKGKIAVSTIPYDYFGAATHGMEETEHTKLWQQGKRLSKEEKCPWFVLHHDPPAQTEVGGPLGSRMFRKQIAEYQPDCAFSGHLHHQPYEGSFLDRIGRTWCFNPGFTKISWQKTKTPNHIALDYQKKKATWSATWWGKEEPSVLQKNLEL